MALVSLATMLGAPAVAALPAVLPVAPLVAPPAALPSTPDAVADVAAPGVPGAQAGACEPAWVATFGNSGETGGLDAPAYAMASFDDGSGEAFYVAGAFSTAGGLPASHIARWDGNDWASLPGLFNGDVRALAVLDTGGGPCLFVGGEFTSIDGAPMNRVACWDGAAWSSLGNGVNGAVFALAVFDDITGSGPALYAAGAFTAASGVPVSRVARWNGTSWAPVGSGINNNVNCLAVYDDGGGPRLHAAGVFTAAGLGAANKVASYDGSNWVPLGSGVAQGNVHAMAVFDSGGGPELILGGSFVSSGALTVLRLARWDGSSWSVLFPVNAPVESLLAVDSGPDGPALYVGGAFTTAAGGMSMPRVLRWDGASVHGLASGVDGTVDSLAVFDDGGGSRLYVSGSFSAASGLSAQNLARWTGDAWLPLGGGLDGPVRALAVHTAAGQQSLYAGGSFTQGMGVSLDGVGRWDDGYWHPLGDGVDGVVNALASFDGELWAGGGFLNAGAVSAPRIASWDGAAWSDVGGGTSGSVFALSTYDDGGPDGEVLVAGGLFATAGGVAVNGIARWNGSAWSPVGDAGNIGAVFALTVFDDGLGAGPRLIAGGNFTQMGGVPVSRIAGWDGVTWAPLGAGVDGAVTSLVATQDGPDGGPALYAGGTFTSADGVTVNRVARWDGLSWSGLVTAPEVGVGSTVDVLAIHDDGSGPGLYVGGAFATAGPVLASRVALWDGTVWSALDSGASGRVFALAAFDDHLGLGTALCVGGDFASAPDSGDGFLARWGGCGPDGPGWTDQGYALPGVLGDPLLEGSGSLEAGTSNALLLRQAAPSALSGTLLAFSSAPVPFKGGSLVPFPFVLLVLAPTDGAGELVLPFGMPVGVPAGTELWVQSAIDDGAAVKGVALSNAVRGLTP